MELNKKARDAPPKMVECPECKGYGEVIWQYKLLTKAFDCPVCHGRGKIEVKQVNN